MRRLIWCSSLGAAIALLPTGVALAQKRDVCVQTCRSESGSGDCEFDAQEAKRLCLEERGCDTLRGVYSSTCLGENRDQAACNEARGKLRDCMTPCHEGFSAKVGVCMDLMATCLRERCGIELPNGAGFHIEVAPGTPIP